MNNSKEPLFTQETIIVLANPCVFNAPKHRTVRKLIKGFSSRIIQYYNGTSCSETIRC